MSFTNGCVSFTEFFRAAYDAATVEPYINRFIEFSKIGDREGMIKIMLGVPSISNLKIVESYKGKNDSKAMELYRKACEVANMENCKESRACTLNEALFAAGAGSRSFLDALFDSAKLSHDSGAFARCLRYCECMLALPTSLYENTAEISSYFLDRRNQCANLEHECKKKLSFVSSQKKKSRGKRESTHRSDNTVKDRDVIEPKVDGKPHATLETCSDAVTLQFDEKKGRHLVANRNIKAGTVLIVDRPFSYSTNKEALERNCLHCHFTLRLDDGVRIPCRHCQTVSFCSEKCREEAWQAYHRYECQIFNFFYENQSNEPRQAHLLLAYRTTVLGALSSDKKKKKHEFDLPFLNDDFLRYHTSSINRDCEIGVNKIYSPHDYRTIFDLETHCASMQPGVNLIRTIEAIFLAKCLLFVLSKMDVLCSKEMIIPLAVAMLRHLQAINCNAYEIVENVNDKTTHVWNPRYVGGAIYPTVSLVNHSCYPNVVRHSYPSGIVVVRTIRFVRKGTDILDCYGPHFLTEDRSARREYLWKKYSFLCACEGCAENWHCPLPETMNYKCKACSSTIDTSILKNENQKITIRKCSKCNEKIDYKKLDNQLRKSLEKRLNAISEMYQGSYDKALPLLFEHIHFIEKFFAAPNIETIKTQQCIIQCYNQFGCTSQ